MEGKRIAPALAPCGQSHLHHSLSCHLVEVPLTFQHYPPGSKKDLAEGNSGVGPHGLVLVVQAEHEGLDEGVAVAEGIGEDIGDARVH